MLFVTLQRRNKGKKDNKETANQKCLIHIRKDDDMVTAFSSISWKVLFIISIVSFYDRKLQVLPAKVSYFKVFYLCTTKLN